MPGYTVDPVELARCDASVATASAHARAELTRVRRDAAAVLGGRWQGSASAAFRLGWEQWLDGVSAMLDALDELATLVGASGHGYATTEDAVRTSLATQ